MNTQQALARREQLREEIERTRMAREERTARLREIEQTERTIEEQRTTALKAQARTGESARVDKLDAEEEELRREHARVDAEARAPVKR